MKHTIEQHPAQTEGHGTVRAAVGWAAPIAAALSVKLGSGQYRTSSYQLRMPDIRSSTVGPAIRTDLAEMPRQTTQCMALCG
jgi:hypothetical protein